VYKLLKVFSGNVFIKTEQWKCLRIRAKDLLRDKNSGQVVRYAHPSNSPAITLQ